MEAPDKLSRENVLTIREGKFVNGRVFSEWHVRITPDS